MNQSVSPPSLPSIPMPRPGNLQEIFGQGPGLVAQLDSDGWVLASSLAATVAPHTSLAEHFRLDATAEFDALLQGVVILTGVCQDITDRKLAENAVVEHAAELARTNAELEQFARVAAHDLQEPLRTVDSFVQLLTYRLEGKLDAQAQEAVGFIVQGGTA